MEVRGKCSGGSKPHETLSCPRAETQSEVSAVVKLADDVHAQSAQDRVRRRWGWKGGRRGRGKVGGEAEQYVGERGEESKRSKLTRHWVNAWGQLYS